MLFRKFFTLLAFFITSTSVAHADFHQWEISELFSNADGSIQFIEMFTTSNDAHLLNTSPDIAQLSSTDGLTTHSMFFPNDLPSASTRDRSFLIATAGFEALAGFMPDYIMADGFLFTGGGIVDFADSGGSLFAVNHGVLPIDGILSIDASGATGTNSPTNFAGASGSIDASAVVPVPAAVWLFGSGLIGMVVVARRSKTL